MIIDVEKDLDFIRLTDLLFSFDFEYKDIVEIQMIYALVVKEKTEHSISFRFYVDTFFLESRLPDSMNGKPIVADVTNGLDLTRCELLIEHGYIVEYRVYNIHATPLNTATFRCETPLRKKQIVDERRKQKLENMVIIDIEKDLDFIGLKDFIFSFDFGCKDIFEKQIRNAYVVKEKTEYYISFRFYVDALCESLPSSFNGVPVYVEVVNGKDATQCELFVDNRYIEEYRLYNINGSVLNMESFWQGTPHYEKTN